MGCNLALRRGCIATAELIRVRRLATRFGPGYVGMEGGKQDLIWAAGMMMMMML